jgi:hypothetical protein
MAVYEGRRSVPKSATPHLPRYEERFTLPYHEAVIIGHMFGKVISSENPLLYSR